ncbi:RDD family protein [Bacillus kwashiorkori]|uniref:RDD family protein n=1 Tax=Bacillus kwashiorkori TaxID=1522318 RepID=UPI00078336C6|nr:RDD family protein [Bacillus kwashiorkori]
MIFSTVFVKREDVHYASSVNRLIALLIDFIILISSFYTMKSTIGFVIQKIPFHSLILPLLNLEETIISLLIISFSFYFAILESSSLRGTIGKKLCKMEVVNYVGRKLHLTEALYRSFFKSIPLVMLTMQLGILFHHSSLSPYFINSITFLFITLYITSFLISKQNQVIYDRATGAFVIKH